jgi:probable HAF family extracellular repeat protein
MQDLNSLIRPHSGWSLEEARAINQRGQIVGLGERNGHNRAFLLTPRKKTL